jgi:hypothetical protein
MVLQVAVRDIGQLSDLFKPWPTSPVRTRRARPVPALVREPGAPIVGGLVRQRG